MNQHPHPRTFPIPLAIALVLFVTILGYAVSTSLIRRDAATFTLQPPRPGGLQRPGPPDTVTVDASDPERWQYIDLDEGRSLVSPDTMTWDVALRRYQIRTRGAIVATGSASFDLAGEPDDHPDSPDTGTIGKWYRYSIVSHLLEPKGLVYLIRTDEARIAKFEVLSYYCPGLAAGCLTFHYAPATAPSSRPR